MIEIVFEFVLNEEGGGRFELTFGPGGAWSRLFARNPGFKGITLLRDAKDPQRYLVVEFWETEEQREQTLVKREAEHSNLESALSEWVESRTELGIFSVCAEATVRPHGRAGKTRKKR